jgi:hypothetical protein
MLRLSSGCRLNRLHSFASTASLQSQIARFSGPFLKHGVYRSLLRALPGECGLQTTTFINWADPSNQQLGNPGDPNSRGPKPIQSYRTIDRLKILAVASCTAVSKRIPHAVRRPRPTHPIPRPPVIAKRRVVGAIIIPSAYPSPSLWPAYKRRPAGRGSHRKAVGISHRCDPYITALERDTVFAVAPPWRRLFGFPEAFCVGPI